MIVQGNARCNMPVASFFPWIYREMYYQKEKYRFQHAKYREWDEFSFFFFLKQGFKLKISRLIITKIIPPIINTFITACKILHENSMISRKRHNYFNETYNVHKKIVHGSG